MFSIDDARLYVVHGRYKLKYVEQEIVWIASYFPRHYYGNSKRKVPEYASHFGTTCSNVSHKQPYLFDPRLADFGQIRRRLIQTLSGILRSDGASSKKYEVLEPVSGRPKKLLCIIYCNTCHPFQHASFIAFSKTIESV